jgi:dipeptidyl aminopeptidase/acylaminoacyl peptidase
MSTVTQAELAQRYEKAIGLLGQNVKNLVDSPQARPVWIGETDTFWYRNTREGKVELVLVDPVAGTKGPAFDHARMAEALKGILDFPVVADALPISALEPVDGAVRVSAAGKRVEVDLTTYTARELPSAAASESPSPDGRWAVLVQDHDLYLRNVETDEVRRLTTDGEDGWAYSGMNDSCAALVMQEDLGFTMPPMGLWSPDSTRFLTHRIDQREVGLMHLVRSAPADGGRPRALSYHYALPGDEKLPWTELLVVDAVSGSVTKVDHEPIVTPFVPLLVYGFAWWSKQSDKAWFLASNRGDTHVWLNEIDPASGAVRRLVEETSDSHITFGPQHQERNIRVLSTGEVLWWSQRSGWGHLYLYDGSGAVTTLTEGEWLVRSVVAIDEDARRVVFTAAGREPGSDPYLQELCSVSLDGGEITAITSDGLDHDAVPSPSGRFVVDITSRYDTPTVSVLRDGAGTQLRALERADATRLYEAGWTPAERVVVKAADGVTDIYCSIYKPHDFDPTKTYPVIDDTYPGPQISVCPLRFPQAGGVMVGEFDGAVLSALGFVVVAIDGRGSAMRSKAFQDDARLVRDAQFVDDHAEAIKQLAATRPWMDLDRVGITGASAGGYSSTRALLGRPDFFKVAVSSSGNHDNRVNHAWWGEKFWGLTDSFDFEAQSNLSLADRLEGKLFLIHGEMDDNAVPHGTMRLVDALIAANKDFDLLIVPNMAHSGSVQSGYWVRRKWDYFVEHLMGETPPTGIKVPDRPLALG